MTKTLFASITAGALALAALPVAAADWNEKIDLCAAAVDSEGLAVISDYQVKFANATNGGSTTRIQLKLTPNAGGDSLIAECKIRRNEVTEVLLKA